MGVRLQGEREHEELASEVSLQKGEGRRLYSPGFYISHLSATNQDVVYVEKPITVNSKDVREVTPSDEARFDSDRGMTLIREVYFERQKVQSVEYTKFQKGDEVFYRGKAWTVTGGDAETLYLRDVLNNTKEADPQACTDRRTTGAPKNLGSSEPCPLRSASGTLPTGRCKGGTTRPPNGPRACCAACFTSTERKWKCTTVGPARAPSSCRTNS